MKLYSFTRRILFFLLSCVLFAFRIYIYFNFILYIFNMKWRKKSTQQTIMSNKNGKTCFRLFAMLFLLAKHFVLFHPFSSQWYVCSYIEYNKTRILWWTDTEKKKSLTQTWPENEKRVLSFGKLNVSFSLCAFYPQWLAINSKYFRLGDT
jgi:hypothetical protein